MTDTVAFLGLLADMATNQDEDMMLQLAVLGVEAERFMASKLGRHLAAEADRDEQDALALLIDADPDDVKTNRDLRNRIHIVRMALNWIQATISVGQAAHIQLQEMEELGRSA